TTASNATVMPPPEPCGWSSTAHDGARRSWSWLPRCGLSTSEDATARETNSASETWCLQSSSTARPTTAIAVRIPGIAELVSAEEIPTREVEPAVCASRSSTSRVAYSTAQPGRTANETAVARPSATSIADGGRGEEDDLPDEGDPSRIDP